MLTLILLCSSKAIAAADSLLEDLQLSNSSWALDILSPAATVATGRKPAVAIVAALFGNWSVQKAA